METRKLYYEDPHLAEFSATVVSCVPGQGGYLVTLDQTAFYPEGGGQACDIGTLGGVPVTDVQLKDGQVQHLCGGALKPGSRVSGCIDWARRFDLMQQHTGEHIVSGIIHAMFGFHNSGFHAGTDGMEVDFDGVIPPEQLAVIEEKANAAVWANLPVVCWYPSEAELPNIFYRTKRPLPWPVRLVQIEGVDSCACCGIHTASTGEVGLIKLCSCTRLRGGVRLVMRCGGRAWQHVTRIYEQNRQISQTLSVPIDQTAQAVCAQTQALAEQKRLCAELQTKLFRLTAESYRDHGNVLHVDTALTAGQTRELAQLIGSVCGGYAVVLGGEDGSFHVCIAAQTEDPAEIGRKLGARGGGRNGFYQGRLCCTLQQARARLEMP